MTSAYERATPEAPTLEEAIQMITDRKRLVFDLAGFIRYKHKLGPEWTAMTENWGVRGGDEVWHVFIKDGVEHRFSGPRSEFEDWQAAR